MELDRFKEINDALGHEVGDALLRAVAERLRHRLHGRGAVARLGTDEFAGLIEAASPQGATAAGHDLISDLERPVRLDHLTLYPRASIGMLWHLNMDKTVGHCYAERVSRCTPPNSPVDDQNTPSGWRSSEICVPPSTTRTSWWSSRRRSTRSPARSSAPRRCPAGIATITDTPHLRKCGAWHRAGHRMHDAVNLSPNTLRTTTFPMRSPASLGRLRDLPIDEVNIDKSFVRRRG